MIRAVDLFAGAGGFSLGAIQAGCEVVFAANHWPIAVETHSRALPETLHLCQDLHQCDWSQVPDHELLLASPCCQGHSKARGTDRPHHDTARSTAWAVVSCAEAKRPEKIIVENVPEFQQWTLYPSWTDALHRLGYTLRPIIADAADAGVPQHRRRLFVCAFLGKAPDQITLQKRPHCPASAILSATPARTPWRTLCKNTRARVSKGRHDHGERFLIAYYGASQGGRSINRPIGTITTRDRYALVEGEKLRMLTIDESKAAMGFPSQFELPDNRRTALHLLGNAVPPPLARDIITAVNA
jgi:DNA (cytosine-5)-methyltransferase 1